MDLKQQLLIDLKKQAGLAVGYEKAMYNYLVFVLMEGQPEALSIIGEELMLLLED